MPITTALDTAPLGTTGLQLSRVGFGAWVTGGSGWTYAWGRQDDADSLAAIRRAVEAGVTWIDTAAIYGLGHSEEVVGQAVRALPEADRPYLFTKAGLVGDPNDPTAAPLRVMDESSVRHELEGSLRRLGVDAIDLYQVHWPATGLSFAYDPDAEDVSDDDIPVETYWQLMSDLKAEGKVRAIGLSNHSVPLLDRAASIAPVDAIQPPFSAIHRGAADQIAWADRHRAGVIVWSPMQSGLLTGAFTRARAEALPKDDWRSSHPDFTTELTANLALAEGLRAVADRHETTVAAVAVAWTLAWPGVTGAIVGARTPAQVDGWVPAAAGVRLTKEDLDEIAAVIVRADAGEGPTASGAPSM